VITPEKSWKIEKRYSQLLEFKAQVFLFSQKTKDG